MKKKRRVGKRKLDLSDPNILNMYIANLHTSLSNAIEQYLGTGSPRRRILPGSNFICYSSHIVSAKSPRGSMKKANKRTKN
jgi:hypothetical protein